MDGGKFDHGSNLICEQNESKARVMRQAMIEEIQNNKLMCS